MTHKLLIAAALAGASPLALAQPQPPDPTLMFAAGEVGGERVVKGAPYCADAVHETIQTLTDGNRIVRSSTTRLCRDGEGRTRQEVDRGGRKQVWLRDPPARETWVLDTTRKTARRISPLGPAPEPHGSDGAAWREHGERMREWARQFSDHMRSQFSGKPGESPPAVPPVPPQPPQPPSPVVLSGNSNEVHVMRFEGHPDVAPLPPLPPAVALRVPLLAPRGAGTVTALPPREIEGLKVNGERTTWTIEAGKIGNEKPIQIVREVWTSPELMLTVLTRDTDPRSGETVYRLANMKRGEPDPALMKVPPDYAATPKR